MKRRLAVLFSAGLVAIAMMASPASAAEMYLSKTSGTNASASWTQNDETPVGGQFGNVHFGWLEVYSTSQGMGDAFIYIDDFDCEPGLTPYGHGEEEEGNGCVYVGTRWGNGYDLAFTMDRKLNSAQVVGSVELFGGDPHGGGGLIGAPQVNVTWTGIGSLSTNTYSYRWVQGGTTYTDRYRGTGREAVLSGNIGAMGFTSDSHGWMSSYRSQSAQRSR